MLPERDIEICRTIDKLQSGKAKLLDAKEAMVRVRDRLKK
jgi:hypothetical protein